MLMHMNMRRRELVERQYIQVFDADALADAERLLHSLVREFKSTWASEIEAIATATQGTRFRIRAELDHNRLSHPHSLTRP